MGCHEAAERPAGPAGTPGIDVLVVERAGGFDFDGTRHALAGIDCTACHGDAVRPVASGPEGTGVCQSCHRKDHPRFDVGPHAALGCTGCHDVHAGVVEPVERRGNGFFRTGRITGSSADCAGCHEDVAATFGLNERHRLQEGILECVDCHDPHAPSNRLRLGGFRQQACLKCHADKGGPWVFEHGSQRVDGCLSCHSPHGSPNRHLLHFQRIADLCYSCHAQLPGFHLNFTPDRDCLSCHSRIHGSNVDPDFLQ
jgi:DmsE family decaheme c-type cytochrome